ncbi:MAG TPA: hypothetical protein VE258_14320, partial [Ktedonobacterales bacterium]|nr:hypothetical protein [Ktedonobacterales bacterium]
GNRGWLIACAAWWLLGIPAVTAVALLLHMPLRDVSVGGAALLLATALAPFAAYKLFLFAWLGDFGTRPDLAPRLVPFSGLFFLWPWQYQQIVVVVAVIVPALICAGMALWALARRAWTVEIWSLLLNIQVLVVMLAPTSYFIYSGTGRITTGVIVAVLLAVPTFDALTGGNRGWLIACAAWWLLGIPAVTAVALLLHMPLRDVSVGGAALAVTLPLPMLCSRRIATFRRGAVCHSPLQRTSVGGTDASETVRVAARGHPTVADSRQHVGQVAGWQE